MNGMPGSEDVRPLCVRLFGTPQISYDGRPVRFVAARTLPLFVFLLLGRERPIARDQLAYKFWPDYSEVDARANLRRHLHLINTPLFEVSKNRWLEVDNKVVTFDSRMPLDLDVAQLEAACVNPEAAPSAVDVYTGDLFVGCDEDWLIPHRERLRTAYLRLLFGLIDRYRGERRFAEAIALSRKAMHVDPFREDLVRTLMSLHYESGNRSSALTEFDEFRERLQTELGAQPMHETQSLHDAIRRHAAIGVRTDRPALERTMPFEGRDDEIEALRDAWRQAASGKGRVAMVSGEAGIGKTRLLREFAILAEREGARVLWGASSAPEASPFEPVIEALNGAITEIGRLSISPALLATLAVRFPELRAMRPDVPESVELIGQRERERLFDAIALATERLCVARPAVMVFEDVHWVFADTFELIARVVRTCARAPLFVVVSFREEEMTSALRSFRQDPAMKSALRVGLDRLAPSSCRKILLGYENVPVRFANRAIKLANGNPLFLSELIRENDANASAGTAEPEKMPATLESAILARLSSLSGPARALIDIAAIGGTVVSIDQVQYASGWPLAHVLDATDELVDRFVLRETATGSRGDYEFAHELIREAVLGSMPSAVQMRRHRRFAAAILELFPTRKDDFARTIAQHLEKAGQPEEAAQFYARAANVAHGQFAWHDAIALADHALRLERRQAERFSRYAAIESAAQKLGEIHRQDAAISKLLALANELDDDALRATALGRSSEFGLQTGDFVRQREATDRLESIARKHADSSLLAKAFRCRARAEIALGRPASAVVTLHSIDALDGLDRSSSEQVADLRILAHAQAAAAAFDAAHAAIEEAERRAGAAPSLTDQIAIVRTRAMLAVEMANREEAARLSPILLDLCRKVGDVEGEGDAHQVAARIAWWSFDIASAREHLRAAATIFERIGKPQSRASVANNAGALENHVGLLDDAERFYAEALGYADVLESQGLRALCHANVAYVALLRRDGARAFVEAQRGLEISRATNDTRLVAITLGHSASALRLLGRDGERAFGMFGEALQICVESGFVDERLELIAEMIPPLVSRREFEQAALFASELERAISANENALVMPIDALAKAAEAFEAIGQPATANALFERARSLLRDRLEKLPDARTRSAYATLHVHQALLERDDYECA
jgi:DNA-binding SARP family transcriptional activator/tetratricopeptide (TPR) repeat protein